MPEIPSGHEDDELGSVDGQKSHANELLHDRGRQLLKKCLLPTKDGGAQISPAAKPTMHLVGFFMDSYQDVYGTPSSSTADDVNKSRTALEEKAIDKEWARNNLPLFVL